MCFLTRVVMVKSNDTESLIQLRQRNGGRNVRFGLRSSGPRLCLLNVVGPT